MAAPVVVVVVSLVIVAIVKLVLVAGVAVDVKCKISKI